MRIADHPDPPGDVRSDDALMLLAAEGSREAYAVLVRRYQRKLRAYCARQCGGEMAGDDAAQDCFVELWRRRSEYEPRGKFASYLFRIAANRCKNQRRKRGRDEKLVLDLESSHLCVVAPDELVGQRRRCLEQSLDKLPEAQREAILLRFTAELDYQEIADLLGKPEPTVRSRVFLGLAKLRKLVRLERVS